MDTSSDSIPCFPPDNSHTARFSSPLQQRSCAGMQHTSHLECDYLCTSPAACSVINELENTRDVFVLNISDQYHHADQAYGPWKAFWNPNEGLCVKKGAQTPALQLLHELVHLWQMKHGQSFSVQNSPQREEEAVQATNPAATQLGEPTRQNYADAHGTPTFPTPIGGAKVKCPCK